MYRQCHLNIDLYIDNGDNISMTPLASISQPGTRTHKHTEWHQVCAKAYVCLWVHPKLYSGF